MRGERNTNSKLKALGLGPLGARLTYLPGRVGCGRLQFVHFIPATTINQERAALGTPCLLLFTARFTRHLYVFIYFTVIILRVSLRIQIKSSLSSGGSDRRVYIGDWSEGALLSSDPLDVSLPTTTQKRRDGPPSSRIYDTISCSIEEKKEEEKGGYTAEYKELVSHRELLT